MKENYFIYFQLTPKLLIFWQNPVVICYIFGFFGGNFNITIDGARHHAYIPLMRPLIPGGPKRFSKGRFLP
jgi:hypothetical protein